MTKLKAIIFDLDGTLLNTLTDLADSMNAALEKNGFPTHGAEAYKYFVGSGMLVLAERALPEKNRDNETAARLAEEMAIEYNTRWDSTTKPYEGIPAVLRELGERKVPLSILSNKSHGFTIKTVEKLLGEFSFRHVLGVREGKEPKPDPGGALEIADLLGLSPEEIMYCGDSNVDMDTATNAGMFGAGVLWGYRTEEELKDHGANAIISKPSQFLEYV